MSTLDIFCVVIGNETPLPVNFVGTVQLIQYDRNERVLGDATEKSICSTRTGKLLQITVRFEEFKWRIV